MPTLIRTCSLLLVTALSCAALAQTTAVQTTAPATAIDVANQTQRDLAKALTGEWVGVLEYRDYSEPESSTKRVQLPTWLSVKMVPSADSSAATAAAGGKLTMHFIYDDGPGKTVDDTITIVLDVAGATYTVTNEKGHVETYKADGFDRLKNGRGDFTLLGPTIDNGRPAESRMSFTVRRNLIAWTEENRPSSAVPFAFRHKYTFTRAAVPVVTQH